MKTIVLMGFSTAGKSSISRLLEENPKYNELIDFKDSDKYIASQFDPIKPNIYKIFLNLTKVSIQNNIIVIDRAEVFEYINKKAKEFLRKLLTINSTSKKCRIKAGCPFLNSDNNNEWSEFIKTAKPDYILLKITAQRAYKKLIERHISQSKNPEICNHPNFGSWDLGVTKAFDTNRFKLLREEDALNNIISLINSVEPAYIDYCKENIFNIENYSNYDAVKAKILKLFEIE